MPKKQKADTVHIQVIVAVDPLRLITTREELNAHDPLHSAFLLVPPSLVYPLFELFEALTKPAPDGAFARAVEMLLATWEGGELPDTKTAGQQLVEVLTQISML